MTPIPHLLAKDSLLPMKQRRYGDAVDDLGIFDDLHFFEVSNVFQSACDLARSIIRRPHEAMMRYAFLPARRTLLDFAGTPSTPRTAFLLEKVDETSASVRMIYLGADGGISFTKPSLTLPLTGSNASTGAYLVHRDAWINGEAEHSLTHAATGIIYALLAMINTPRIIGRRQHMPHRGLEKRLLATRSGMVEKFPDLAWIEIVLEVSPTQTALGGPREAHLTGERARHFCRTHLRLKNGRIELVTEHWRGNEALGTIQSRYRLEPPRGKAAA